MIHNIKMTVEYDGSSFCGWQIQEGDRTVQEELQKALEELFGRRIRVICAGRTDAGVHAKAQTVNFLIPDGIAPRGVAYQLTPILPDDILVRDSQEVPLDFHARFDAKSKTYRYLIENVLYLSPWLRHYRGQIPWPMDLERMKEAASYLQGEHDFRSFTRGAETRDTVRSVDRISIEKHDDTWALEFQATSFLYNQVRIMAGTLVDAARGKIEPEDIQRILESKDRLTAGQTMPPGGLYLVEVEY